MRTPTKTWRYSSSSDKSPRNSHFYTVKKLAGVLSSADYFGVGETHRNTIYKTTKGQPTEFIVIPRDTFESKSSLNHQLVMMTNRISYHRQTSPELYRLAFYFTCTLHSQTISKRLRLYNRVLANC